uniref:Uncharacterized protein n=1 Tax=Romanomermis culicivorax TaxID=13658 RepID=A0A915I0T6_ROMCU
VNNYCTPEVAKTEWATKNLSVQLKFFPKLHILQPGPCKKTLLLAHSFSAKVMKGYERVKCGSGCW